MTRPRTPLVRVLDGCEAEFRRSWKALSDDCVEAFLMVLKELERDRPEPDHMYGEMDARHCVYMVELPDCDGHRLVASVDRKGDRLSPTILHLVIAFGEDAVDRARREAARQLKLVNPSWDPKK